ncbi:MAG: metallophosphoesterase family protein [Nitrospinota bacterium]
MKYALFSDIHSNLEAFESVLKDISRYNVDKRIFLGDIIGYGPNPAECIDLMIDSCDIILAGNHDWALIGKTPGDYFNKFAQEALEWTATQIREDQREFLMTLVPSMIVDNRFQIAHSSPFHPEEWRYILSYFEALENYNYIDDRLCFIGHSHQPLVVKFLDDQNLEVLRPKDIKLEPEYKYIANIGSVGQPRDSIPTACWVHFDSDKNELEFHRVAYDIEAVQKKIHECNLSHYLAERLGYGR